MTTRSGGSGKATGRSLARLGQMTRYMRPFSAGRKHQGLEHWLPFFQERLETIFDYLPNAAVLLDDQLTPGARGAVGGDQRSISSAGRGPIGQKHHGFCL